MSEPKRGPTSGSFKPGRSGNPGGRPRGVERRFREVAESRTYTANDGSEHTGLDALAHVLLDIAFNQNEEARDRRAAVETYTDRGWGKPKQSIELSEAEPKPVDWTKIPEHEREQLLPAVEKLLAITALGDEPETPTEH